MAEGNTAITVAAGTKTVTLTYGELAGAFTITVNAAGEDTTPPGKVTGLAAAPGNGRVTLTWTDPADADLASVEITWTPGNGSASVPKGTRTYTAAGLTNGTEYTFTVRAKDAAGNLSAGETAAATPAAALKGDAEVTAEFNGLPQDETITLSGVEDLSQAAGTQLTATVSGGSFTAYRWFLDGVAQTGETGSSLTLDAGDLTIKQHELTVFVTAGGVEYAKAVKFAVTY